MTLLFIVVWIYRCYKKLRYGSTKVMLLYNALPPLMIHYYDLLDSERTGIFRWYSKRICLWIWSIESFTIARKSPFWLFRICRIFESFENENTLHFAHTVSYWLFTKTICWCPVNCELQEATECWSGLFKLGIIIFVSIFTTLEAQLCFALQ